MPITVRDPIHGSIALEDWAVALVDAPVLQRLRRIHQLGTAHLVYPGAHHRRFEHSLGAHHLAGRLAASLGLADADARTVRAAALLHDVGHGPFSHAFEELLKEEGRRHEEASVDLVRWGPLGDLLRQGGIDPVAVADCIAGTHRLAPVVAGTLDADRMDYLLRDAHYTGVRSSVDVDRLIGTVEWHDGHVVLQESGLLAAEGLLTTRFLMYPAVYLHHTVRASEAMLLAAVRSAVADGKERLVDLERESDDGLLHRLRETGGAAADLVLRLDERRLYKRAHEGGAGEADAHVKRLQSDAKARRRAEREIADAAGVAPHHVLVDVPQPPKFREAGLHVRGAGGLRPLTEASRLVKVLQEARMDHWRFWVFCPKQDRERVAAAAQRFFAAAG